MVVVYNIDSGEYLFVNKAIKKILGFKPEDFLKGGFKFVVGLVHPDDLPIIIEKNQRALDLMNKKGASKLDSNFYESFEYRMKNTKGDWRWLQTDGSVFKRDGKGKIEQVINISIDITNRKEIELRDSIERKNLEESLRKNESRFRTLIENSSDVVVLIDKNGIVTYISPSVKNLLGFTPEDLMGQRLIHIYPEDLQITYEKIQEAMANPGKLVFHEARVNTKRGNHIWIEAVGRSLIHDPAVSAIVVNFRDITDRKNLEESFIREQNRITNLLANVPGVVWEAWGDPKADHQRIDFVSNHVETMLGYTTQDWLGTPNFWLKIVHPEDQKRAAQEASAIFKSSLGGVSRFRWLSKSGRVLWVEAHSFVVKDEKGDPIGMRGVTMD